MSDLKEVFFSSRSSLLQQYFYGIILFFIVFAAIVGALLDKFYSDSKITLIKKLRLLSLGGCAGIVFWFFYSYSDYFSSFYAIQCQEREGHTFVNLKFIFHDENFIGNNIYFRRGISGYRGGNTWTIRIFLDGTYGFKSTSMNIADLRKVEAFVETCGILKK